MSNEPQPIISKHLAPLIEKHFQSLGFSSNDGYRFFRVNNNLVHFMIFSVQHQEVGSAGVRTGGNHLLFRFGEFLTYDPNLDLSPRFLPWGSNDHLTETDAIVFKEKKHFKTAAAKVMKAISDIDSLRFSKISSEEEYENFRLRGSPSILKLLYLTTAGRQAEVDVWVELLSNKHRGLSCTKSYENNENLEYFLDQPSSLETLFIAANQEERNLIIDKLKIENIKKFRLEFLNEAV
ncbi:hypothetical protein [Aestuariibacter salexigens]|uniref:hypothetical protein n=1 Tax=Aestuariibacter salexigens TaxID=226010 RepID=UPI0004001190|nr:hypothetical protein [Aestuariibacter salexigens]